MKKVLLIVGTIVVVGITALGFWVYDIVQNGVRDYQIAGETVGLAGFSSSRSTSAPDTWSGTFTERLMPFTVDTFPFKEACEVMVASSERPYDFTTITAANDEREIMKVYATATGTCTEVDG